MGIFIVVLVYSMLQGVDFVSTSEGTINIKNTQISPDPLGELSFVALSADKPESPVVIKVRMVRQEGEGLSFVADSPVFSIEGRIIPQKDTPHFKIRLRMTNRSVSGAYSLSVYFRTYIKGEPRFLIPGIFYKYNRPQGCTRMYPGLSRSPADKDDPFLSNYWSFRSDRAAEPAVFGWNEDIGFVLATQAVFEKGQSGLYIMADDTSMAIGLHFPYREEPVKYSFCYETQTTPECTFFYFHRGEAFDIHFDFFVIRRDLHFYAPFLRSLYERDRRDLPTHSWMDSNQAMGLLAEGLHRWHYDEIESVLWETCSFDKYFGKKNSYVDRYSMHLAWLSGAPTAMALLWYGRFTENDKYIQAGIQVLDKVASGIAPLGTFYPRWVTGKGWSSGWVPEENLAQARTAAETTLFLFRAFRLELQYNTPHSNWLEAIRKSLDFAVRIQREDGNFGSYYTLDQGEVTEWDGAAGILWIAPLIGASLLLGEPRYREAAVKAGNYYARFLQDEFLYGAPEDVHLTPSSEDGYNALISYLVLAEVTHEERWLKLARAAADWLLTFRFSYNTRFPQFSILSTYNFHTKGGDVASPCNQCLHSYGLVCHPELMKLGRYLEDDYYIERAREHLEFCHQFIARDDGDFGARKGMVPEQFYHTDWWQPKGHLLALSHAWCAGLILYANLWEKCSLGESSFKIGHVISPVTKTEMDEAGRPTAFSMTPTEEVPPSERETLFDL